jgi:hypothetical protein
MAGDVPDQYQKDFTCLKGNSDRGLLYNDDAIYKRLDEKAKNLPGLRRASNSLDVRYK